MPKTKISEYSATANSNTDVGGINIDEGCAPSGINDAIRTMMAQLKNFQTGTGSDSFNGPVGSTTASTGAFTTLSATGNVTLGDASTDTLNVGNGGLVKDASGNVGIGTGSPTTKLDVLGGGDGELRLRASSDAALIFSETTANKNWKIKPSSGDLYWQYSATAYNSGYSSLMVLQASGNLGIGTTSPAVKLDVNGIIRTNNNIQFSGVGALTQVTQSDYVRIIGGTTANTDPTLTMYGSTNGNAGLITYDGASHRFRSASGGTEYARIDSSGNLGLGVTPSAWFSGYKALETGSGSLVYPGTATNTQLWNNLYVNTSGNVTYKTTGIGGLYSIGGGGNAHTWYYAASGTAGTTATLTQAMTLDSSGNLLVGQTARQTQNSRSFDLDKTDGALYVNHASGDPSGNYYFACGYNGNNIGSVTQSGTTAVLYNTTSDQRLKENIQDADSASTLIDALQVRQFDWKTDNTHQRYGFIAQELVTVAPEAVHQPADPEAMMAVDYSKLVPMLVKEIQSLRQRLAAANL